MHIKTSSGNIYSYLRQTNEIIGGIVKDQSYAWNFNSLTSFSAMPEVCMFIIGITEKCNLRCTYCCYSGEYANNRSHGIQSLASNDIDAIFDFIQHVTIKRPLRIAFYGGEPLLKYSLVQYAIVKGLEIWKKDVVFSISTNGTVLTPDKIDWMVTHNVELAISIDGTEPFHNRHRVDSRGNGSYTKIYEALSYIQTSYQEYMKVVSLQMTLASYRQIQRIAEEWHNDPLLKKIAPSNIHGLAPNFANGVGKVKYDEVKELYLNLLDVYEKHQDWSVLKVFFEESIAYWKDRPILDAGKSIPMATCMPVNIKLYIDSKLQLGVCEKVADKYRIGNVYDGIDWKKANAMVREYYNKRVNRCTYCPAVRMCEMCLTAIEYTDEQWDILCHNERVYAKAFMLLFCEMAERGLIK